MYNALDALTARGRLITLITVIRVLMMIHIQRRNAQPLAPPLHLQPYDPHYEIRER